MTGRKKATSRAGEERSARSYAHPEARALLRPDVETQAQFRKERPPAAYRYDSDLSPALDRDGQNPAREQADAKIESLADRVERLSAIVDPRRTGGISESGLANVKAEGQA